MRSMTGFAGTLAITALAACGGDGAVNMTSAPAIGAVSVATAPAPSATTAATTAALPPLARLTAAAATAVPLDDFTTYAVAPVDANGAASQLDGNRHRILVPAANRVGRLFLFIGGTTSVPDGMQEILKAGAANGFHVISLAYPNDQSVDALCHGKDAPNPPDPNCTGDVRYDIVVGKTPDQDGRVIDVAPEDSILGRLRDLLKHLDTTRPQQGWRQFMPGNAINWSKITVAGHSQGAGHAAYLAKFKPVARAVVISGVYDRDIPDRDHPEQRVTAPWLSGASVTPAACIFGFVHTREYESQGGFAIVKDSWRALGLGGAITSVDERAAPYRHSHQLTTSVPTPGNNPHVDMIADVTMPRDDQGVPLYRPVWTYLAFTPGNYGACG